MELWTLIVQSNAFNFIILLIILYAIMKAVKLPKLLENAQDKVKKTIDDSTSEKENSELELKQAQENLDNVDIEIKEIEAKKEENIKALSDKIEEQTEAQISSIKDNTDKLIDLERTETFKNISKETASACVELAKKHIISVLAKKPNYHQKFIKQSIEQLSELNYNEK